MVDRELRDAARAVQQSVVPPDLAGVVARGAEIRRGRRRRNVAAGVAAVALAVAAVTVPGWTGPGREPEPAAPPATDSQRTAVLLSDPRAVVASGDSWVSDTGAVLQRVTLSSSVGGRCPAQARTALVWHDPAGGRAAWSTGTSGRRVSVVPGGFAVGAPPPGCEGPDSPGAYTVDASGARHDITWSGGPSRRCSLSPGRVGCVLDATTGAGTVVPGARTGPGPGFLPLGTPGGKDAWAVSEDGTVLARTVDGGRTWQEHASTLPVSTGDAVQATASGRVGVFFAWPRVEVTRDGGRSWQVRDLASALAPVLVANPLLSVTSDGVLAGVSYPTTGRPFVFASTSGDWTSFARSDFRTTRGDFDLGVSGPWLWNHDTASTWVSSDGLSWQHVAPLSASPSD